MPRRSRYFLISFLLIAAFVVAARSVVVVDETEFVLVTEFGRPVDVFGDGPGEAGPHGKWPWQSSLAIDRRLQVGEPPAREAITGDKKNLDISPYVVWRVVDPIRFLGSAGSLEAAGERLDERISAALSDAVGRRPLETLASIDPRVWGLDVLTEEVRKAVEASARSELGIELIDVRLRRFNFPVEVRPAVFDLIRSERRQVAASTRAEGEADYQRITSTADRDRDALIAEADAEAERLRGRGEAEATRILNLAHAKDPKFYEFLRTLETYRAVLDDKATVILSTGSPLLRLLTQGPPEDLVKEKPAGASLGSSANPPEPTPVIGARP